MTPAERYEETLLLPRAVRFPVELIPPENFQPERLETWPALEGRLEWVNGKLLYMPPCGDYQQDTVADVVHLLGNWTHRVPGFVLGTNEAGMLLSNSIRAADAAIWRRADLGSYSGRVRRVPPLLAVEVSGEDEGETELLAKAQWYLSVKVPTVWLLFPTAREVLVVTATGNNRFGLSEQLPVIPDLPGLQPRVSELFRQITQR